MRKFYKSLKVGQNVWWNDPDEGLSSGTYKIEDIGEYEGATTVISLSDGYSYPEVYLQEIEIR